MRTIIYQSDMRANDPVGGCYRYIQELQAQIEYYRAELELVLQQLAIFRAQAHHHHHHQQAHHVYNQTTTNNVDVNVGVNGDEVMNADPLTLYNAAGGGGVGVGGGVTHYHYLQQVPPQHDQYMMVQEVNDSSSNNNNGTALQEHVNVWSMQNSLSSLSLQGQNSNGSVGDEYDHKPMLDMASDDRNELGFEPEDLVHRRFVYS